MIKAEYNTRGPVPADVIEAVAFERPILGQGEVLLEMLAAPINPSDVLSLTGEYGMLPPLPAVGGNEGVAQVVEHGPGVRAPALGQRVLLPVGIGSWASHMVAKADGLVPLPNDADSLQLSMLTVNPPTASLLLSEFVNLQPGDWVIQNAANSAVGHYLIQLARLRGFKTVNLVRRQAQVAPLLDAGADVVLVDKDEMEQSLAERVTQAISGADIRLGIDAVGGAATGRMANVLAEGATLVNYGAMSGEPCSLSPQALIFKGISVRGFWLAKWFQQASKARQHEVFGDIIGLIAKGKLSVPIHATFALKDIKTAINTAVAGNRHGKVLLVNERFLDD